MRRHKSIHWPAILLAFTLYLPTEAKSFEPVKSGVMKDGTAARQLTVDLNGADDLYLVATYAGDSYDSDQAIWANPLLHDAEGNTTDLTTLKPVKAQLGWGSLLLNRDHRGRPLTIGGRKFDHGFWAHAPSCLHFIAGNTSTKPPATSKGFGP